MIKFSLSACIPDAPPEAASRYAAPLVAAMERHGISTIPRVAAFLAQIGHESGGLRRVEENLRYSADRLRQVFPKHFPGSVAEEYAGKPEAIANRAYADRMGNGPEASGDGWRFRGRGLLQVTGRANYTAAGHAENPDYLTTPEGACESAAHWWETHGCNDLADSGDMTALTRRVNGGTNGLEYRLDRYRHALHVLWQGMRLADVVPTWATLSPARQVALTGLAEAVGGVQGFLGFRKLRSALSHSQYGIAADQILDSGFARREPERATALASLLRGGA